MTAGVRVDDWAGDGPVEVYYAPAQVDQTANVEARDFIYGVKSGVSHVRVSWAAEVPLAERHKVMQDLVTLYNLRYGLEVT